MSANNDTIKAEKKINLKGLLQYYLRFWWVFLISFVFIVGMVALYVKVKTPTYEFTTAVILNDDDDSPSGSLGGGLGALMSSFSIGGLGNYLTEDELYKMSSHNNLAETSRRLGLHKKYWRKDNLLSKRTVYYNDSPIEIQIPDEVLDTLSAPTKFKISISKGGKDIHVKVEQKKETVLNKDFKSFPITVNTPYAMFRIVTTPDYNPSEDMTLGASVMSPDIMAHELDETLTFNQLSKKSSIIQIFAEDANLDRGKETLQTVVQVYNDLSTEDRTRFANSTIDFVNTRLLEVYDDLQKSEKALEEYKTTHKIVDPEAEADYLFKQLSSSEAALIELETREQVLKMAIDFLRTSENKYSLIPFTDNLPETPIAAYNELVLRRIQLQANGREDNAQLRNVDQQIDAMRSNLLTSLEKNLSATKIGISDLRSVTSTTNSRITEAPSLEMNLISLKRDNLIKNQIYGFLLQKREENAMKSLRQMPIGKVIEPPYVGEKPKGLGKGIMLVLAAMISLCIPAVYLWRSYVKMIDSSPA